MYTNKKLIAKLRKIQKARAKMYRLTGNHYDYVEILGEKLHILDSFIRDMVSEIQDDLMQREESSKDQA